MAHTTIVKSDAHWCVGDATAWQRANGSRRFFVFVTMMLAMAVYDMTTSATPKPDTSCDASNVTAWTDGCVEWHDYDERKVVVYTINGTQFGIKPCRDGSAHFMFTMAMVCITAAAFVITAIDLGIAWRQSANPRTVSEQVLLIQRMQEKQEEAGLVSGDFDVSVPPIDTEHINTWMDEVKRRRTDCKFAHIATGDMRMAGKFRVLWAVKVK